MVYTKDSEKANRIASLIDAGQVGINCYPLEGLSTQSPWYVCYTIAVDAFSSRLLDNLVLRQNLFCSHLLLVGNVLLQGWAQAQWVWISFGCGWLPPIFHSENYHYRIMETHRWKFHHSTEISMNQCLAAHGRSYAEQTDYDELYSTI